MTLRACCDQHKTMNKSMNFAFCSESKQMEHSSIVYLRNASVGYRSTKTNFCFMPGLCKVNPKNNQLQHTTQSLATFLNHYPLITMSQFTL